jgi:hypothetical protein
MVSDVQHALDRLEKTVRGIDPNDQADDIVEDSPSVESSTRGSYREGRPSY